MAFFGLYETKSERETREAEGKQKELQRTLNTQTKLFETLYEELKIAARDNREFNVMQDGKKVERLGGRQDGPEIGPVTVCRLDYSEDGKKPSKSSVIVGIPDNTCLTMWRPEGRGFPVLQADINLTDPECPLHLHEGAYGGDECYLPRNFDAFVKRASDLVENYRLFK